MNESSLSSRYDASSVEQRWYEAWEQAGLFSPDLDPTKPRYTVTIPPPNITGSLHMGHALCYPLQDVLGRYRRLQGDSVLIVPGQDHAGIATQSVVEKQLRKEGSSGAEIGRDAFVERVWSWRKESGDTILNQLRRLGCAFDWSRLRFTLDDAYAEAVHRVFVDWFERGLIFRGKRVVNWDPVLKTSVSDIETERRLVRGKLYYIRYPFADGSGHVVIATTRPETMLADVAVAVHPSDARYKGLVGKTLLLPLMNREIPLIADIYPDPEFGSGAVKITPAHDANDYAVGQRHDLPMPVLLDERARITSEGGPYAGLDRVEARKRIVADLEAAGLLEKIEDHEIALTVSERSGEPIEPLLSEQWFVDQPKLAGPVLEAMRAGRIRFSPERYERIFVEWLENIRDWNLSRQLWWGHRIPIYYTEAGEAFAGLDWNDAQAKAGDKKIVRQDDDVLDTWFSSGLWPFAVLGWPEATEEFAERYPTSVLVTDRNIINLWVARMAMMSLDLLHEIPFHHVFIYATVLTEDGRRMSKSLGTGVDPMGVIESFGADAMRWTLLSQTGSNQDIRYSDKKTEDARNFCNKIWNATRFVLLHTPDGKPASPGELEPADKWLLSRLVATERAVRTAYESYDLQVAAQHLYKFWWSELCDWYIEVSKSRLTDSASATAPQWVLLTAIEAFVTMLHPLMPFLTEEVYSHLPLPEKAPFLMAARWPELPEHYADGATEADVERAFEVTRALRALRAEVDLPAMKSVPDAYYAGDLRGGEPIVQSQAWIETLHPTPPPDPEKALSTSIEGIDLWLPLAGLVDPDKELARLGKEKEKLADELAKLQARLANPQFVERAKPEVVERERATAADLEERIAKLEARQAMFG
ncbi:MAG: valine--tRNA ligase [Fimbriimonadaceae bacterium]|nr:valine--tRNA ligase [Fimbriimonadaceae bacterium]